MMKPLPTSQPTPTIHHSFMCGCRVDERTGGKLYDILVESKDGRLLARGALLVPREITRQ